ncbi:MAG: EfeM/EfeO family lipoprotein [Pseudonocardia sp.]|nr:EfeM/EfeO family lipoprotein [Pseudonocardia sp.]
MLTALWPRTAAVLLAAFAVGLLTVYGGRTALSGPTSSAAAIPITVGENSCGRGWSDPRPGAQTLWLRNTGSEAAEVQLVELTSGAVLAEVAGLGSGASAPLRVELGGGRYALRCVLEESNVVTGPAVGVPGPATGPAGVIPVTRADLAGPLRTYQASVLAAMTPLLSDVATLRAAVYSGDRDAARRAWLPAHLDYQRLGAAYGAFGDLDEAIDGRPDRLLSGVSDPEFTGFRRLEYGLWHDQPMPALRPVADALVASVTQLRDQAPNMRLDGLDLTRRVHEILEDTERFELTGHSDDGSGTTLAAVRAQVDATNSALDALRPLLRTRDPALPEVDAVLAELARTLDTANHNGVWIPLQALDHSTRQRINALVGQALELLAPIAVIAEPRQTS